MADSFHPARLTRLGLAHQRRKETPFAEVKKSLRGLGALCVLAFSTSLKSVDQIPERLKNPASCRVDEFRLRVREGE
jgi:hypothetical protein